jgi:hypothetical protein
MNGFKVFVVAAVGALAMLALPAVAAAKDRNHDHIPDRWEVRHHLSLHRNQARLDQDHDHLRNRAEFLAGDNPRNPDTDNDGIMDGEENAGTIQSFDQETGKLTISLFGGETISGMVDEGTEIECDHQSASASSEGDGSSSDGEEQSGDNGENEGEDSGDHQGEEAGDDNGEEQGEEAGDDNGENQGEDHGGEPGEDDQGEDHGGEPGEGDQGGNEGNCTTADLTEGAVVKEADLHVSNGQAVFEKVELAG